MVPAAPDLDGSEAENLLGEFRALLRQVGLPGAAAGLDVPFWAAALDAPNDLRIVRGLCDRPIAGLKRNGRGNEHCAY